MFFPLLLLQETGTCTILPAVREITSVKKIIIMIKSEMCLWSTLLKQMQDDGFIGF